MGMLRHFFILFFGIVPATIASAQQGQSLTVEEAVQIGLQNSKTLHSSRMNMQYTEAKASEMGATRLPSLKLGGSYARLSEVPPFQVSLPLPTPAPDKFVISPAIFDNYNSRLSLQQPLFTGFRLQSSTRMAKYNAQAAQENYSKDKRELIYDIKNAYWNLYKATELKKVIDENVEQVKSHLQDVQNFYAQGMATNDDVLKVQVQLSSVQLLQIDAKNAVQLAMIRLNSLIGLPLDQQVELSSRIEPQAKEFGQLSLLVKQALLRRPEAKIMEFRVKSAEAGVTLAKSGWYPQIYLTGNYYYARPNPRILPARDEFKDSWDIGVSVSFDIWNWGTTGHQTNQAQAQLFQAQDALGQLKDGITLEVTQSYLNVLQSKEKIAVAQQGVQQAEESYRMTNEKYKMGLALNTDLLDAEVALLRAKTNHTQALVDFELAQANLQKTIGEE